MVLTRLRSCLFALQLLALFTTALPQLQDRNHFFGNREQEQYLTNYQLQPQQGQYYHAAVTPQSQTAAFSQQNFPETPTVYQRPETHSRFVSTGQSNRPQQPAPFQLQYNARTNTPYTPPFLAAVDPATGSAPFSSRPQSNPTSTSFLNPATSTTIRRQPQYSHLHNHNPSQTETFLGQITIQNPANTAFSRGNSKFKPSTEFQYQHADSLADQFPSQQKWKGQTNNFPTNIAQDLDNDFLNSQTLSSNHNSDGSNDLQKRPSTSRGNVPTSSSQNHQGRSYNANGANSYFNNEENYNYNSRFKNKPIRNNPITTTEQNLGKINPSKVNRGSVTFSSSSLGSKYISPTFTSHHSDYSLNIEPLLEDQITNSNYNSENDNVDVVESEHHDYQYEDEVDGQNHPDYIEYGSKTEDYKDEGSDATTNTEEYETNNPTSATTNDDKNEHSHYDIITINSKKKHVHDDNFDHFVDSTLVDSTEEPTTENWNHEENTEISGEIQENHESEQVEKNVSTETMEDKQPILLGEAVVSVVTTKSVVNGTISVPPVTQSTTIVTEATTKPSTAKPEHTTENWVVVASVQTSRSVSGARFLPFDTIEQEDKSQDIEEDDTKKSEESNETIPTTTPMAKPQISFSTESIIDKLDRVQSELSSGILAGGFRNGNNNITVITETVTEKQENNEKLYSPPSLPVTIRKFSPYSRPSSTQRPNSKKIALDQIKMDDLSGLLPAGFKPRYSNPKPKTTEAPVEDKSAIQQNDSPKTVSETNDRNSSSLRSIGKTNQNKLFEKILENKPDLPKVKIVDDISGFLPDGFKLSTTTEKPKAIEKILQNVKTVDISAFLPADYKETSTTEANKNIAIDSILKKAKPTDISALLPPGYKLSTTEKSMIDILQKAKPVDISALLPPGYELSTTEKSVKIFEKAKPADISAFLPPGFNLSNEEPEELKTTTSTIVTSHVETTKAPAGKIVFPTRPGGRKPITRVTTPKSSSLEGPDAIKPTIRKGLPTRATTEFTGWPTPPTTPISIEKLLEAARTASGSSAPTTIQSDTTTTSTTSTTTTSTTPRPTTPGLCMHDCDLAATIKLIGGAQWVPELLDHNTREWQLLANQVQTQLENVYSKSNILNRWYKKIRIDEFSEGSVLVDYFIELNDLGRQINTQEMKQLFHAALEPASNMVVDDENLQKNLTNKLVLGNFIVDPTYTDFIVLPKQISPTVGFADENVLLPQWAIAVIVIGLASLLFVIIFGVTVLVNRQKNAKKRQPIPLTEDMLNELNKNHMGGIDNYGAEDLYNMEDVWNDKPQYDMKFPKKRSGGSLHDNSMSNLYDSWRSEWNGYYYNAYYGNPGSSAGGMGGVGSSAGPGYSRRRSDYDTNF